MTALTIKMAVNKSDPAWVHVIKAELQTCPPTTGAAGDTSSCNHTQKSGHSALILLHYPASLLSWGMLLLGAFCSEMTRAFS